MSWTAYLLIFALNGPPVVAIGKHEPFPTQEACNAWVAETKPATDEFIAKLIDEGAPVISHSVVCILPEEDGRKS